MELNIKGENIKLKKDYLTNGEVNYIVSEALQIYMDSGDISNYDYSPLSMITNFYAMLFELCIEDYDMDKIDDYNKYYNLGVHYELLRVVTNAEEAYHLLISTSKDLTSIENVIDKNIKRLMQLIEDKIPDSKAMTKLINKLPKEWQKVVNEYNDITGKQKEEGK